MDTVFFTSAYLAPVQYYSKLVHYSDVFIETHDNYIKQTYRTRCDIAGANGRLTLSIPVDKGNMLKCLTKDIRISYAENWQRIHWRSIESAYRTSSFFDYYEDDFRPFYEKKFNFLFDFNEQLRELVLSLLDLDINTKYTDKYEVNLLENEIDLREKIHPKKDFLTEDPHFKPTAYYQVFEQKNGFLPNLSIIDLLFNMGNETRIVLRNSFKE